jgi:hypothetical protein
MAGFAIVAVVDGVVKSPGPREKRDDVENRDDVPADEVQVGSVDIVVGISMRKYFLGCGVWSPIVSFLLLLTLTEDVPIVAELGLQ